jgi:hypothetical protein
MASPDYLQHTTGGTVDLKQLLSAVDSLTQETQKGIADMKKSASSVNIADMMALQLRMNKLSQATEMASTLASALNQSIQSVAQKIK